MSMASEQILEKIDGTLHNRAVAQFAQVLANCESMNWEVAQRAHEDVQETLCSMGSQDYDALLAEATEFMVAHDLRPLTWLP